MEDNNPLQGNAVKHFGENEIEDFVSKLTGGEEVVQQPENNNKVDDTKTNVIEEEKDKIFGGKKEEDSSLKDEDKKETEQENDEKEVEETTEDSDDSDNGIDYVKKLTGFDVLDEAGNPIVFEDTLEGMAKYTETVVEIAKKQTQEETTNQLMNELISEFPDLPNIINHLKSYGTIQNYVPVTDYTKIKIAEDNKVMQEQIIMNDLIASGISGEDAKDMVNFYKDKGTLLDKAQNSLKKLQTMQVQEIEQRQHQERLEAQKEQEAADKWYQDISSKINEGKINGYTIPANEKQKFFEYIAKPVNEEGHSQAILDEYNSDIDTRLFLTYLRYNKFDLKNLVKEAVAESKVKSLKDYKKNNPGIGKTQPTKNKEEGSFEDLAGINPKDYIKMDMENRINNQNKK